MTQSGRKIRISGFGARPNGSVLLFAIVLLALLAMLGTTFILFVRQNRTAATNMASNIEGELAAQSAFNQAQSKLHSTVYSKTSTGNVVVPIVARKIVPAIDPGTGLQYADTDGNPVWEYHSAVFNPADLTNFIYTDSPNSLGSSNYASFEAGVGGSTPPPIDIAFWHFEENVVGSSGAELSIYPNTSGSSHFTTAPMTLRSTSSIDLASRIELQGFANDFYAPSTSIKPLPRISSTRGEYSVWLREIDSNLYAIPMAWGMDTAGVPGATDTRTIAKNILTQLKALTPSLRASTSDPTELLDSDLDVICNFTATANFPSFDEFTRQLASCNGTYNRLRGGLESSFRVQLDLTATASGVPFPTVREHPASFNINTASVETIAAAISQIPAEDTASGALLGTNMARAMAIAKRIAAKRPFLCRMDFEDFLAAHLMGSEDDPALSPPDDALTMPDDSHIDETQIPFVRRIYYAMLRRWGPDNTLAEPTTDTFHKPELSLEAYLEIPGVKEQAPEYKADIGGPCWPNYPRFQRKRFEYFFLEDVNAPRASALITPKEFNNFANSICMANFTDDVQKRPAGSTADEFDVVISAGPNATLETTPQGDDWLMSYILLGATSTTSPTGDDEVSFDDDLNLIISPGPNHVLDSAADTAQGDKVVFCIAAGPNGIAETSLPRGRPSYYSFIDDGAYADTFWGKIDSSTYNPATDIANKPEEFIAAKHMKFYYRLKPADPMGMPPSRPAATLKELVSWSCYPDVGSERKPGFYQLTFNDWVDLSPNYSYGSGPMLAQGDPDEEDNQTYSTAKRISGAGGNGDVSWSPQFAYRSRFFGIYVLGRGAIVGRYGPESYPAPTLTSAQRSKLVYTGDRRIEAVYDALNDQILMQRTPVTDRHSLAPGDE